MPPSAGASLLHSTVQWARLRVQTEGHTEEEQAAGLHVVLGEMKTLTPGTFCQLF
jgi:hypothetical protein